jgi:hypothetical protein
VDIHPGLHGQAAVDAKARTRVKRFGGVARCEEFLCEKQGYTDVKWTGDADPQLEIAAPGKLAACVQTASTMTVQSFALSQLLDGLGKVLVGDTNLFSALADGRHEF